MRPGTGPRPAECALTGYWPGWTAWTPVPAYAFGIAAADPSIAGLVLLAADTQPMREAAVRVARYLVELAPGPGAEEAVSALVQQAASVAGPELTPDTPSCPLSLGLFAAYWLDLRAYDPVATAADRSPRC
ncbi:MULTISPECIES: hypothetical protein [Streptomyces]|uniref:Uncharacterized protein n=1 Tax=Streptomyces canarius TaxID=285453 RepID=A0ABQ3DAJ7_9ACTN|nr:hypothetical protein [Streptomyces canarius]GHA67885.1 hypothetical protein GCM10010345_84460 [Streptomyces canarius]